MTGRRVVGVLGVVALTSGVALAGTVAWQAWHATTVESAAQTDASGVLDEQWRGVVPTPTGTPPVGAPIARLSIPRFGNGWTQVLFEGVDQTTLAKGPGHYPGAGTIGRPGNYAIAGHRVFGPFDQAAELMPCDPIVVTTGQAVFTYRVLPFDDIPAPCALPAVGIPGREIVTPDDVAVIADRPDGVTTARPLLTITTCNPRFSARQRLVIHAVLVDTRYPAADEARPGSPGAGSSRGWRELVSLFGS